MFHNLDETGDRCHEGRVRRVRSYGGKPAVDVTYSILKVKTRLMTQSPLNGGIVVWCYEDSLDRVIGKSPFGCKAKPNGLS